MSNQYGLDFLRSEHTLNEDGQPNLYKQEVATEVTTSSSWATPDIDALIAAVQHKPDLEKQFDVIDFLKAHRSSGCLAPTVIYQRTGIDLQENEAVANMLHHNPKIRVENVPDPENPSLMIATYAYQAKYNHVHDRTSLLAQINRCKNGVARRDLEDAYDGVEVHLDALITAGDVVAISNTEDKDKILFPRGEVFLVELDGIVTIPNITTNTNNNKNGDKNMPPPSTKNSTDNNSKMNGTTNGSPTKNSNGNSSHHQNGNNGNLTNGSKSNTKPDNTASTNGQSSSNNNNNNAQSTTTSQQQQKQQDVFCLDIDIDARSQIRRGEAVQVGGQWFRVSSAVKEGPLKDQPARAQAPLSVVSMTDLSIRNENDGYIRPLNATKLPLDGALASSSVDNLKKAKIAREKLHKVAHGRSGGVASQLLGSHAHASNPTTLAASFGTASAMAGHSRKRPNKSNTMHNAQQKHDLVEAKNAANDPTLALYTHARRHGCTKDVREMYLATRKEIPTESESEFHRLLLKHKLLDPTEQMRRPRFKKKANVDNDGKPKKRRYYERKNQRMTNTHLEGTEIGAVLRRATEKQKQGEQVGDGGM